MLLNFIPKVTTRSRTAPVELEPIYVAIRPHNLNPLKRTGYRDSKPLCTGSYPEGVTGPPDNTKLDLLPQHFQWRLVEPAV